MQETFGGDVAPNKIYGPQDGCITKLGPDGKMIWSTYFGGDGSGVLDDIVVLANGNIAFTTHVRRGHANHHISANAYQKQLKGASDAIVGILDASGASLVAATYFGGSGSTDSHPCIAVDDVGDIYLLFSNDSRDIPTTANAVQANYGGGREDLTLAKFSADLTTLLRCTYFGGKAVDYTEGFTITVDAKRRPVIAGETRSDDLLRALGPGAKPLSAKLGGVADAFVAIISADFTQLVAGTYLGGSDLDREPQGIHIDAQGNVVVAGSASSSDFPVTADAHQPTLAGGVDAFATVLSPDLSTLRYSTLLGGTGDDKSRICAIGPQGEIVFAGQTSSTDFPTLKPIMSAKPTFDGHLFGGGKLDNFVAKLAR